MSEETIYSDSDINITTARIVVQNQATYVLRNISSVKTGVTEGQTGKGCGIVGIIIGILLMGLLWEIEGLAGFGFWEIFLVIGAILFGIGMLKFEKPAIYHLVLSSSSGETQAFSSPDLAYIEKVVAAINEAILKSH